MLVWLKFYDFFTIFSAFMWSCLMLKIHKYIDFFLKKFFTRRLVSFKRWSCNAPRGKWKINVERKLLDANGATCL